MRQAERMCIWLCSCWHCAAAAPPALLGHSCTAPRIAHVQPQTTVRALVLAHTALAAAVSHQLYLNLVARCVL